MRLGNVLPQLISKLSKKISSLKLREDIRIIYSTFLYYLTFELPNRS